MSRKSPASCETMADLRAQIDALDAELVARLVTRAAYIDRAVEIKQKEDLPARIDSRVREVIDNVRRHAQNGGIDPNLADTLWTTLIEWSIAREAMHIPENE